MIKLAFALILSLPWITGCGDAMKDFVERPADVVDEPSVPPNTTEYRAKFYIGSENHLGRNTTDGYSVNLRNSIHENRMSNAAGYSAKFSISEQSVIE